MIWQYIYIYIYSTFKSPIWVSNLWFWFFIRFGFFTIWNRTIWNFTIWIYKMPCDFESIRWYLRFEAYDLGFIRYFAIVILRFGVTIWNFYDLGFGIFTIWDLQHVFITVLVRDLDLCWKLRFENFKSLRFAICD